MFFLQVIAERETTVRLVAERESLKTQLCTAQTTHTELEAALKDAERRLLETLAALESQKDEFNAKERADAETAETLRRMKEAQSDKETDFARLRTSLAESQATIASLNADIEGTHATHAREIERLNDELTAERTKVTSSARDVEELTKKLAQSESESVAFNQSAHTEKLQLQKRLEEVSGIEQHDRGVDGGGQSPVSARRRRRDERCVYIFNSRTGNLNDITCVLFNSYSGGADATGIRVQIRKLTNRARQKAGL